MKYILASQPKQSKFGFIIMPTPYLITNSMTFKHFQHNSISALTMEIWPTCPITTTLSVLRGSTLHPHPKLGTKSKTYKHFRHSSISALPIKIWPKYPTSTTFLEPRGSKLHPTPKLGSTSNTYNHFWHTWISTLSSTNFAHNIFHILAYRP